MTRQKRLHHCDFIGFRIAVLGRTPGQDIGDIDGLVPAQINCGKHLVQQLTGPAHKGATFAILIPPGRFADDHDTGTGRPIRKDKVARPALQLTMVKRAQRGFQGGQICRPLCRRTRHGHRIHLFRCAWGLCRLWRRRNRLGLLHLQRIAVNRTVADRLTRAQLHQPIQI